MNVKYTIIGFMILITFMPHLVIGQQHTARLTVCSDYIDSSDTLELYVWRDLIGYELDAPHQVITQSASKGQVVFELDSLIENNFIALYFSYQKLRTKPANGIIRLARISAGDDIQILIHPEEGQYRNVGAGYDNGNPVFIHNWGNVYSGKGSEKMEADYKIERYLQEVESAFKRPRITNLGDVEYFLEYYLSKAELLKQMLGPYKKFMNTSDYESICVDGIGSIYQEAMYSLMNIIYFTPDAEVKAIKPVIERLFELTKSNLSDSELLAKSPEYLGFLKKYFDAILYIEKSKDGVSRIVSLVNEKIENKLLRDRLLANYMIDDFYRKPNKELYDYALYNISDSYALSRVEPLKMFLKGNGALEFSLPDKDGKYYELSDYKGKVVLVDFWYMGCIPCRVYIEKVIKPLEQKYNKDSKVEFILINLDKQEVFRRVIEEGVVPKQAVNLNTEGLQFNHPLIKKLALPAYPYPMLIDKQGKVVVVGSALKDLGILEKLIQEERGK